MVVPRTRSRSARVPHSWPQHQRLADLKFGRLLEKGKPPNEVLYSHLHFFEGRKALEEPLRERCVVGVLHVPLEVEVIATSGAVATC